MELEVGLLEIATLESRSPVNAHKSQMNWKVSESLLRLTVKDKLRSTLFAVALGQPFPRLYLNGSGILKHFL